jgi:alcohol/geraniol dehydrogenase (NADP+)
MTIHGHAAYAAKQPLKPLAYEPGELGPYQVEVRTEYCGICHSDIHLIDDDWAMSRYPFIPGHEIIGPVIAMGKEVDFLRLGQRVGIGWQAGSCLHCEWCLRGMENLCAQAAATCVGRHGGYAESVRVDSRFAFPIPDGLDSPGAAPLLCGGATVYSPLRNFAVQPWHKVGIIGIGGLGHLAIRFASAFGCEVTAFSTSPDKEEESRRLGARYFVAGNDREQMARAANSLDFILSTPHTDLDWVSYMQALRPRGTLCVVGAPAAALLNVPPILLLLHEKRICGSNTGGRAAIQEMLAFAARHGISATVEIMPMSQVNAALDKVRAGKARYRMVLKS